MVLTVDLFKTSLFSTTLQTFCQLNVNVYFIFSFLLIVLIIYTEQYELFINGDLSESEDEIAGGIHEASWRFPVNLVSHQL